MYDLPSENPEDPGLPDEFHIFQPALLSSTLHLPDYANNYFTGSDIYLYYDSNHTGWYKRPDWFLSIGVPKLYGETELRLSYVVWQEGVSPFVAVELLSPGTENEDLGETEQKEGCPPPKWDVYESILKIPYYIIFDRYTDQLRVHQLKNGQYERLTLPDNKLWIPKLNLGIGVWNGIYEDRKRLWLRWFDENDEWIKTPSEQAAAYAKRLEIEAQRAQSAEARLAALQEKLRAQGLDPDKL